METILVTGGAGFIGSHVCVELVEAGFRVVVIDNFVNSTPEALDRIASITGERVHFMEVDMTDSGSLDEVFLTYSIDAVIHLAGLKAVGDSVINPLRYYLNNLSSLLHLCECMQKYHVHRLVFSSSATVYGPPQHVPIKETHPVQTENPYGRTKHMSEQILRDFQRSYFPMKIVILRYFNPIGAHPSGLIGENPTGVPNNIMPYMTEVAIGKLPVLQVFGNDYPTRDGTCIRDYVHITDLAKGHVKGIEAIDSMEPSVAVYNLGTGEGTTVKELLHTFEHVTETKIPFTITDRRPGDVAVSYADVRAAERELGWKATKGIEDMCRDAWRWQHRNPAGYVKN
ncbi:UDP-galactose-4-epimerase [Pontibacillus chungwhensis BH030062]|uniref:UDP-glucose 4-epimerase n=1 Tax=Pontibacillus chungwhensis BH030062 TaxID=1385513 RepID=A0A0A2UUX2_9BACI|nr:UDP-glucose 4-epimerase GalE [Pontibacillus chungwhensis]KGP90281.1 UDP-galactose-4-epimerase [Pontibacillus chungwhensis BH030062]